MIRAVMVIGTQAKPRLLKFYTFQPPEWHRDLVRSVFQLLSARPDNVSNFVKVDAIFGPGTKMVYKHLATLYFVFVFDSSENELAMLDLTQAFVETLDRCFKNVCELDILFNFNKLHTVLDEMILGGQVIETSSEQIMTSVEEIARFFLLPSLFHVLYACYVQFQQHPPITWHKAGETIEHNQLHTKVNFRAFQRLNFHLLPRRSIYPWTEEM